MGDELAKKADQTELEDVKKRQNILVGSETGSRVCVTDAFEAPLEGLVLYGKSTQVTTTGAQLFEAISNKLNSNGITITFDENGEKIVVSGTSERSQEFQISKPIQMQAGEKYVLTFDEVHYFENVWLRSSNGVNFCWLGKNTNNRVIITVPDSIAERTDCVMYASTSKGIAYNFTINHLMLNTGSTALPWEPYTGGKPSPSPNYPQEIQNAKGEVVVHGKNLFGGRSYYANYANSILTINGNKKKEEVKLPYAPEYESFGVCKVIKCKKGKTYVISVTNPNKNANIGMAEYENIENASAYTKNVGFARMTSKTKQLYTAKSDGILVCGIAGTWTDGKTTVHECTESELLQVEEASEATTYESYRPSQIFTITSPTGLPGIPVPSGGNYTDETSQQWICDEVDLERGVYVQRVYSVIVDGVDVVFSQKGPYCNINLRNMPSVKIVYASGQRAATKSTFTSEPWGFNQESGFLYRVKENYAEIVNESCRRHNGEVIYALATPIETPLSETDIAAYRALTTYGPTTIVETDGAGMKLDYQQDVNIVIKQLTDAIASMTN